MVVLPHWGMVDTLGVALYRNGQWQEAIDTLEQMHDNRRPQGRANDGFFIAMSHWHLGHRDEARKWYDDTIELIKSENLTDNSQLIHFRSEAEALLK